LLLFVWAVVLAGQQALALEAVVVVRLFTKIISL